ncbi:MAG: 2,3-bisphosphoglycerate-independent phosphoglycerate mutase [Acidimicrobiales bacterium]|nr:2,3-bisphosphoglycerate-independent phosphoglycerate mutase [Acidimicrobiales bacterium]MDG1876267.1 2,3-bisphosphoglycerate-independent phosphoglycerate mutase [Acidimicrobiales bacterium]
MSLELTPSSSFPHRRPVLVVIADGVGEAPAGPMNAVTEAATPTLDRLAETRLYRTLKAHGPAVGLPSDDDMGNSEVGHNALGSGRVFAQGAKLVNQAIASGDIFESTVWQAIVERARPATLHLLGLHSDGNVHSHNEHLYALMRRAVADGIERIRIHILLDGRDVDPRSALTYIDTTEAVAAELNSAGADVAIASGGGRMTITMDRYGADWPMVERGYWCHAHGEGRPFPSARAAVETMYAETDDGDQYLGRFIVADHEGDPVGAMTNGDALVLSNFRGDRAIEISQAFEDLDFGHFDRGNHPDVLFAGMLQYDGDLLVPANHLVAPPSIDRTMGEYLCASGLHSFAVSETQKFGHVTYFWNGNRSGYFDEALETYVEIPSDNVEPNTAPEMKLREITEATISLLRSGRYSMGRINFPNGDMVGHTGDLKATIDAMQVLDDCVDQLVQAIDEVGGVLIFTADHGNADVMYTEKADGEVTPKTSHTLSPVPFVIHDGTGDSPGYRLVDMPDAGLANVAATVLDLMGYEPPADYEPSLIEPAS